MKFLKIQAVDHGEFLHRYDIHYEEENGKRKIYEMVSRDGSILSLEDLRSHRPDAVIAVLTDEADEHILLLREFRMEQGEAIYGLPGGLIEDGESPAACLSRELLEETGLQLTQITEIFPPAPCCVGISNESAVCLFGRAKGIPRPSESGDEEIEARWFTRDEVIRLQKKEKFGSWALAFSWVWAHGGLPGSAAVSR